MRIRNIAVIAASAAVGTTALAGCAGPESTTGSGPSTGVPECATAFAPPRSTTRSVVLLSAAHRDVAGRSQRTDATPWPTLPSDAAIPLEITGASGTSDLSGGSAPLATTYLVRDGRAIGVFVPPTADRERFDLWEGGAPYPLRPAPLTTCEGGDVPPGNYDVYASVVLQLSDEGPGDLVATGGPWRVRVDADLPPLPTTPAEALACGASTSRLAASAEPYRAELMQNRNINPAPGSVPSPQIMLREAGEAGYDSAFLRDLTLESVAAAVVRDDVVIAMTTTQEHASEGFEMLGKVDLTFPATACDGSTLPDGPVDVVTAIEVAHVSTGASDLVVSNHWQTTVPLY